MAITKTNRFGKNYAPHSDDALKAGEPMQTKFNHAANDSPRSGSSKKIVPAVWAAIVVAMVAGAIWFGIYA
jgi:hypothetical protein